MNEKIYSTTQVGEILNTEFQKFTNQWHGVMNGSDLATLSKFIEQVKDKLKEPQTNLA